MANAYSQVIREMILTQLDLSGFTEEEKGEILDMLQENILMQVHIDIVKELSPEKKDEFYKMSERVDSPAIQSFLAREVSDFAGIVKRAVTKIVREFTRR